MTSSEQGAPPPRNQRGPLPAPAVLAPADPKGWSLARVLQWTVQRFTEAGLDSPRVDAEHLLAHALGCARVELYVRYEMMLDEDERARFRGLVKRRLAREPVAYIEGTRGFHALDLELAVDRRVLIPRPETELLVDWVLERLPPAPAGVLHVLDVGTGSGAIALSLKRARPDLQVVATDISEDALQVARGNAERAGLAVALQRADVFEGVATPDQGFVAIVSNPPYIARAVLEGLQPEVAQWEPALALDGGADGLDVVARVVDGAPARLAPNGLLALEIGYDQAARVVALCEEAGLQDVQTRKDLAGHVRMVLGYHRGQKLGPPAPA